MQINRSPEAEPSASCSLHCSSDVMGLQMFPLASALVLMCSGLMPTYTMAEKKLSHEDLVAICNSNKIRDYTTFTGACSTHSILCSDSTSGVDVYSSCVNACCSYKVFYGYITPTGIEPDDVWCGGFCVDDKIEDETGTSETVSEDSSDTSTHVTSNSSTRSSTTVFPTSQGHHNAVGAGLAAAVGVVAALCWLE